MVVRQPGDTVRITRETLKVKRPEKVICLPDWSGAVVVPIRNTKSSAAEIIQDVIEKYGISVADILGSSRQPYLIKARHEACYLIAENTNMAIAAIGRLLNKDHTTIMNAIISHCRQNHKRLPRGAVWRRKGRDASGYIGEPLRREPDPTLAQSKIREEVPA